MPPMPLDFSMVRSGNDSPGGSLREGSPRSVSNSAFRVVTPKGKLYYVGKKYKRYNFFLVCIYSIVVLTSIYQIELALNFLHNEA